MARELGPEEQQELNALQQIIDQATAIGLFTQVESDAIFADIEAGLTYDEAMMRLHNLLKGEVSADELKP